MKPPSAIVLPLLLAAIMGAVTLDGGFVFDDDEAILTSSVVQGTVPLWEAFTRDFWGSPVADARASWRPLLPIVWRGLWLLGDGSPLPFRTLSLLLHVFATWALVRLGRALALGPLAVTLGACLFAVHPARSEAVGAIVAQADILAVALGLAALCDLATERPRPWRAAFWLLLACLAKESAVVFAAAGLLLRMARRESWAPALPALCVAVAAALVQLLLHRPDFGPADNLAFAATGLTRILHGLMTVGRAAGFVFVPVGLAPHHGYGSVDLSTESLLPWASFGLLVVLGLAVALGWALRSKHGATAVLLGISLATLVLQSNLIVRLPTDVAERLLYPVIACVCLAAGVLIERLGRRPRWWVAGTLVAVLAASSAVAQRPWKDEATLWANALENEPANLRVQRNVAAIAFREGRYDDGLWHYMLVVWLESRMPDPIDWDTAVALEQKPVAERLVIAPAVLAPDAPCPFALRWLNRSFRDPAEAVARWEVYRAVHGCQSLTNPTRNQGP